MSIFASMLLVATLGAPAEASTTGENGKTLTRTSGSKSDDGRNLKRKGGQNQSGPAAKKGKKKKKGPKFVGPFAKDKYPRQERLRPLVLPAGMVEAELNAGALDIGDGIGAAAALRGAVGIGDVLELGVGTGLGLAPSVAWNETIGIEAHVLAVDGKNFDWAPGLSVPISLADGAGFGLAIDLTSRVLAGKKVFVFFGNDALPITITPDVGVGIAANGGLGFQVSKGTVILIDTSLATLSILPDVAVTGAWETFIGNAAVQYSPARRTDIGIRANVANTWSGDAAGLNWGAQAYGVARF